jgi:hypothetical protein
LEEIMRALNAVALPSSFPQVRPRQKQEPDRAALPSSFQEALKLGWTIVKEESAIDIGSRRRSGVVLLRSKTVPVRLRVPYVATAKLWKFSAPVAIAAE